MQLKVSGASAGAVAAVALLSDVPLGTYIHDIHNNTSNTLPCDTDPMYLCIVSDPGV
jgi:hypothetical protein